MWFVTIPDGGHVKSLNGDGNLPYHLALLFDEGRRIGEITFDQAEMKHIQMVVGVVVPAFTDLVNDGPIREGFQSLTWPLTNMIAGMCALASAGQSLVIDSSPMGRARDFKDRSQLREVLAWVDAIQDEFSGVQLGLDQKLKDLPVLQARALGHAVATCFYCEKTDSCTFYAIGGKFVCGSCFARANNLKSSL